MKWVLIFLTFFLLGCSDFVPKESDYMIIVNANGVPVPHNNRLRCGDGDGKCRVMVQFTFEYNIKRDLRAIPTVYVYGDGFFRLNSKRHGTTTNTYELSPNITYEGYCEFRKTGTTTILFAWVYDRKYYGTQLLHIDNF